LWKSVHYCTSTTGETAPPTTITDVHKDTASFRKLTPLKAPDKDKGEPDNDYFTLMSMNILKSLIKLLSCPSCTDSSTLKLTNKLSARMGFTHKILIFCEGYHWEKDLYTSKNCKN